MMGAEDIVPLVFVAIFLAELILSVTFARFYFAFGIPVFRRHIDCNPVTSLRLVTMRLESSTSSGAFPGMIFHDLGNSEYAFRESLFTFFRLHYTPVMRGIMSFDREHRQVRVVGLANWWPMALIALFVFFDLGVPPSEAGYIIAFACGVLALIYVTQAWRFSRITDDAAALWSKSTVNPLVVDESAGGRLDAAIKTLWRVFMVSVIAVPILGVALMLIGSFTEEWTCQEEGSDWKCVGGHECYDEGNKRFDGHRRAMSCKRTDWPMIPVEKVGDFLFSRHTSQPAER